MTFISSNANDPRTLNFGGGIAYLAPSAIASKAAADTAFFRNLGFIDKDNNAAFEFIKSRLEWRNGSPSKKVYEIPIDEAVNFSTQLSEVKMDILDLIFGSTGTHTEGSNSTTIAADPAPTATVFTVADASDFSAGEFVSIDMDPGDAHDYYQRGIKSISGDVITLAEALPAAPAENDTVKNITKSEWDLGGSSSFTYYGFKYVKKFPIINYNLTIVLYKVGMGETITMNYQDDAKNILPVTFSAISDDDVESGKFGFARLAPVS
jgi:hypothetical protein